MVIGNSSCGSLDVLDVCLQRDPQYQHTNRVKAKAAIQNKIEKVEVVDKVSMII